MFKKSTLPFLFAFYLSIANLFSQQLWTKVHKDAITQQKKEVFNTNSLPKQYVLMNLNLDGFKSTLPNLQSKNTSNSRVIQLPNANGQLERFSVKETSYLAPALAEKFPMIKSFSAQGIDNPSSSAKISIGKDGVHAIIFSANEGTSYINPYTKDYKEYIVYKKSSLPPTKDEFSCKVEDTVQKENISPRQRRNADDGNLRTYRMAIACTGEYAQFHINNQGVSSTASDAEKKAAVLSAMNTTITRVNAVYERDLAVRMVLVGNNDALIFLDASTDGLTNDTASTLIDESQEKCDNIIGDANYDIGHTFSTGAGGLAQLNSVCVTNYKAQGVTGRSQPIGDTYDIDYVAHEVGHQFGATHTFNNSCDGNRSDGTAVEPGSGSTIMAYAGICSPNVQNVSDDYFHAVSIAQMWNHVQGSGSCATSTSTGNNAPTANAGNDVSIPKSTPFILKGQATDADGTASLTYSWEQIDNEIATMSPLSTNTGGPMFRSLLPSSSPDRYMPALSTVLSGNTSTTWEVLPSVVRELDFALTVRDNHSGGGSSARDDIKVTVTDAEAFTVTSPNSAVSWGAGSTQTITWNKGTTDLAPINCANVNIKLSTDGGLTYPITLKSNTPNDGSEDVIIPDNPTTSARILVEAADNIFYNVNNSNLTIFPTAPTYSIVNNTGDMSVCNIATNDLVFDFDYNALYGFNETVNLSYSGAPANSTVTLSNTSISSSGKFTLTVTNLTNVAKGDYTITVTATSGSITKSVDILLNVNDGLCNSSGNIASQLSITNVTFNSINNNSTKTTGYSNFTSQNTEVVRGDNYNLTTTINTAGNSNVKTFAWIDWNQNCVFDTNETYDLTSTNATSITVPEGIPTGATIMRVSTRSDADPNSCNLGFNGEVEDYTITVLEPTFSISNSTGDLSVCKQATNEINFDFDYTALYGFNETVNLSYSGAPINSTITLNPTSMSSSGKFILTVTNLTDVANGDYTITVTANSSTMSKSVNVLLNVNNSLCNSSGNTESQLSITNVTFNGINNNSDKTNGYSDFKSVTTQVVRGETYDLTTAINTAGNSNINTFAWIDWNKNCAFDANETYDLTSNTLSITVPEDAPLGSTTMRVSTKANSNPNSCGLNFNGEVEDYTVTVEESFATDNTLFDDLQTYPIPSNGEFTVSFKVKDKESTIIRLFDFRGRLIETQKFSTISSQFNEKVQLTKAASGLYLLQVENAGKQVTRKIAIR
ncbi:reprolysin-like metallopeptidase [Tenacibaculum singaporense]|uniref:T9SS C-terminal target domain-containing protein n=1 Tax=Tenacibaculum singaporense TaxID=2358479 RepID=A0A3Q8RQF1_9FLAO|nr:GEVED domain-containing protein [Tenacibaculum singaporense]AZJ36894.1 T9SS C-terminal target domain-containing protein [Tenacibaculum singaporense]